MNKPNYAHKNYQKIVDLRSQRKTYEEIAQLLGITKQRVHIIAGGGRLVKLPPPEKKTIYERFWEKVDVGSVDECWEWTAGKFASGYGHVVNKLEKNYSHRVAYILSNGIIPNDKIICHTCDNPACCNPNHLYAGTYCDNAKDRESRTIHKNSHNTKFEAIKMLNKGISIIEIAKNLNVCVTRIYQIRKNITT